MLVTGATGFVGRSVVRALRQAGCRVAALVRSDRGEETIGFDPGVSIRRADIRDATSLRVALQGISAVVHAAADTSGTLDGGRDVTIQGTRNVLDAAEAAGVKRFVYVSSCSVYAYSTRRTGEVLDEDAELEPAPERRGAYSWAKTIADDEVGDRMQDAPFDIVTIRPGLVWGNGVDPRPAMVGVSGGPFFFVIGPSDFQLPLVHVDDLADAIRLAVLEEGLAGLTLNAVNPEHATKADWVDRVLRPQSPRARCLTVPYSAVWALVGATELLCRVIRATPPLTLYRLNSSQRPVRISSDRLLNLGWTPKRSLGRPERGGAAPFVGPSTSGQS